MQKAHQNINWENKPSTETPINETNLNLMDRSIDTIDDRVVTFDTTKANQSDLLQGVRNVTFTASTGTFHITYFNGTVIDIDTDIEKIIINFSYDSNPSSPHYQCLVLTLDDGTVEYIDLSALITQYEFTNTPRIAFTVDNDGKISADIVGGSITDDKLQPQYLADITAQAQAGAQSAINASDYKLDAEAWANGTRNGQAVPTTDPAYHNNSKYWSQQANVTSFRSLTDVDIDDQTLADGQYMGYDSNTGMITNMTIPQQDAGVPVRIIVISEEGSTVTITKPNGDTVTPAHVSTGHWQADFSGAGAYGTYVIDAVLNGDDAQVSLTVDDCKTYIVDDSHFHADITVTYPSGATVSCSKTGEQTMYATSSPYTFTVHSTGVWTITGTRNGVTETQTVTITTNGQTESITLTIVPTGSTVTPTDDIQIWLMCAGIEQSYTTLNEVLADDTTLLALITNNNACDYLARSTTWATGITADSNAMAIIGSYDYCANALLDSGSTWAEAILNSAYDLNVLNVSTPDMTSDTAPKGECIYSSYYNYTGAEQPAWKAYDKDASTTWSANNLTYDGSEYIGYGFTRKHSIRYAKFTQRLASAWGDPTVNIKYQASDDKSTWTDVSSPESIHMVVTVAPQGNIITAFNTNNNKYFRCVYLSASAGVQLNPTVAELDFLGRESGGVQTWLKAGGIQKPYTQLSQVLGDTATLRDLMASHNAVDYLVTAKAFIDDICANQTAMSLIGANDYASTTLFSDADWCTAIINSSYVDLVANAEVPTMTSNTTPKGVASASYEADSNYQAYKAFNGNDNDYWSDNNVATWRTPCYVQYNYERQVKCYGVRMVCYINNHFYPKDFSFYGSNDGGTTKTTLLSPPQITTASEPANGLFKGVFTTNGLFSTYGYNATSSNYGNMGINTLQFYGRENGGVQTWLQSAGITDKNYTTIAEIASDATTLATLISSHDATDYLVTAKGLIDDVCGNSTIMSYIGLDNYCSNTLLNDMEWRNGIANSTYFESVLNVKVPAMTSATTPSGEVINSTAHSSGPGYYAFTGDTTKVFTGEFVYGGNGEYVGYKFDTPVKICCAKTMLSSYRGRTQKFKVQASTDGTNWVDISNELTVIMATTSTADVPMITCTTENTNYYYRYLSTYTSNTSDYYYVYMSNFYGREDV